MTLVLSKLCRDFLIALIGGGTGAFHAYDDAIMCPRDIFVGIWTKIIAQPDGPDAPDGSVYRLPVFPAFSPSNDRNW